MSGQRIAKKPARTVRKSVNDATSRGNVKPSRCDLSQAWVDDGPSPAGNPGPYLKAPVVLPEDVGIVERIYPLWFVGDRMPSPRGEFEITRVRAELTANRWEWVISYRRVSVSPSENRNNG